MRSWGTYIQNPHNDFLLWLEEEEEEAACPISPLQCLQQFAPLHPSQC